MNILKTKQKELQMIFIAVIIIFAGFLLLPFIEILYQSIAVGDGVGLKHFATMLDEDKFATAFGNSIVIASTSAILSTLLAFILPVRPIERRIFALFITFFSPSG